MIVRLPKYDSLEEVHDDDVFLETLSRFMLQRDSQKEDLSGRHADAKELYRDPNGGVPGPDKVAERDDHIIDRLFDTMRLV